VDEPWSKNRRQVLARQPLGGGLHLGGGLGCILGGGRHDASMFFGGGLRWVVVVSLGVGRGCTCSGGSRLNHPAMT